MQNQQDLTKFEFLLTLEGNFIIQRFFNVMYYNPLAKNSMDLYYCVQNICDEIAKDLKMKSAEFVYDSLNYFTDSDVVEDGSDTKDEYFLLEIKLNEEVFIQRIFPAYVYHPKARYSVDIRPKIRNILADLTDVLSATDLETTYQVKNDAGEYVEIYNLQD